MPAYHNLTSDIYKRTASNDGIEESLKVFTCETSVKIVQRESVN